MGHKLTVELTDAVYDAVRAAAAAAGSTPDAWVAARLAELLPAEERVINGQPQSLSETERLAVETRLFQYIGAVSLGHPLGADNESIDADLAREYRAIREDPI